ncbi:unnamed protein product [Blepharisma stoltei]|uniref:Uncharacterized protein n=1 Tax=Blepharisma stoltei TaxID=1481888 RepID=A0AAU9KC14_9CILI|nr:unnamed protein product [Blepharisma stoltei]
MQDIKKVLLVKTPTVSQDPDDLKDIEIQADMEKTKYQWIENKAVNKFSTKKRSFLRKRTEICKTETESSEMKRILTKFPPKSKPNRININKIFSPEMFRINGSSLSPVNLREAGWELDKAIFKGAGSQKETKKLKQKIKQNYRCNRFSSNVFLLEDEMTYPRWKPETQSFLVTNEPVFTPPIRRTKETLPLLHDSNWNRCESRIRVHERLVTPSQLKTITDLFKRPKTSHKLYLTENKHHL